MKGKKIAIAVIAIAAVVIASLFASGAVSTKSKGGEGAVKSTVTEQSIDIRFFITLGKPTTAALTMISGSFIPLPLLFPKQRQRLRRIKKTRHLT